MRFFALLFIVFLSDAALAGCEIFSFKPTFEAMFLQEAESLLGTPLSADDLKWEIFIQNADGIYAETTSVSLIRVGEERILQSGNPAIFAISRSERGNRALQVRLDIRDDSFGYAETAGLLLDKIAVESKRDGKTRVLIEPIIYGDILVDSLSKLGKINDPESKKREIKLELIKGQGSPVAISILEARLSNIVKANLKNPKRIKEIRNAILEAAKTSPFTEVMKNRHYSIRAIEIREDQLVIEFARVKSPKDVSIEVFVISDGKENKDNVRSLKASGNVVDSTRKIEDWDF